MKSLDYSRVRRSKAGGIYLTYQQIEKFTEEILEDYNPLLLKEPSAIENDDFLENYLGVHLEYRDIYTSSSEEKILGCAIFSKQMLAVFDKENNCKNYIEYDPNSVVLDLSLIEGDRKVQENITGLHEAGHIWIHGPELRINPNQISIEDWASYRICCRKSGIEKIEQATCSTAEMWREWQATTYAVTLALSRPSLKISVPELFKKYGVEGHQLVTDADSGAMELANYTIPQDLHQIYNMSKEAIRYRLQKVGYYTTKKKYEEEHTQMTIFDYIK